MSTPEQPGSPALTRKQLRDIRNTGATPIVTGDEPVADPSASDDTPTTEKQKSEDHSTAPAPPAPRPRASSPAVVHDLPGADASIDLGVTPLTRRQARQQELIRTASVPVITPDVSAAHAAAPAAVEAEPEAEESTPEPEREPEPVQLVQTDAEPAAGDEPARAIVNPRFGSELLAGEAEPVDLPPSFDQLITRSGTGSVGTGSALILSQTPSAQQLVAPVTATGEVLITGSFQLPEGLGSTGHAPGTADGKEVDAVLVDGELPAHSSPTPIAASAAISTVKNGGDIIKPPAPEKGGKLMLTLAITAGVLALALVGVLILAFVTGVF